MEDTVLLVLFGAVLAFPSGAVVGYLWRRRISLKRRERVRAERET
jgi:hypothetical protein